MQNTCNMKDMHRRKSSQSSYKTYSSRIDFFKSLFNQMELFPIYNDYHSRIPKFLESSCYSFSSSILSFKIIYL